MKKKRNNKRKIEEEDMFDFEDEFEDEFEEEDYEGGSSNKKKEGFFSKLFSGGDKDEFEEEFDGEFEEEEKPVVRRKDPIATPPPKRKAKRRAVEEEDFDDEYDDDDDNEIELDPQQKKIALGVLAGLAILFLAWVMWPSDKKSNKSAKAKANTQVNAAANLDNLPAPTSAQGHSDRAQAYFNIQNYDKALVHLNKTIAIDPNFEDIHRNKGMLYSLTNRHDLAIPEFDIHIQTKPEDFIVYHWRGIAKFNVGQFAESITDFSEVINRDAPKGEYLVYRSQAHNSLGNKKEAIADVEQAQSLGVEIRQEYLDELQSE